MKYKRILLKLSGEALSKGSDSIFNKDILENIYQQVKYLQKEQNAEVSIVIGGGNIWRGEIAKQINIDQENADYMGMMATSINALALTSFFNNKNLPTKFINALNFENISKEVKPKTMDKLLKSGTILIFGGGTGKPFFSTDTAASIRAKQINADVILIAKNDSEGVFDKDPNIYENANHYSEITFEQIIQKNIKVIDHSAIKLLKGQNIDVIVFNMNHKDFIKNLYNNNKTKKTILTEK